MLFENQINSFSPRFTIPEFKFKKWQLVIGKYVRIVLRVEHDSAELYVAKQPKRIGDLKCSL